MKNLSIISLLFCLLIFTAISQADTFEEPYSLWLSWCPNDFQLATGCRAPGSFQMISQFEFADYMGKTLWSSKWGTTVPEDYLQINNSIGIEYYPYSEIVHYDYRVWDKNQPLKGILFRYSKDGRLQKLCQLPDKTIWEKLENSSILLGATLTERMTSFLVDFYEENHAEKFGRWIDYYLSPNNFSAVMRVKWQEDENAATFVMFQKDLIPELLQEFSEIQCDVLDFSEGKLLKLSFLKREEMGPDILYLWILNKRSFVCSRSWKTLRKIMHQRQSTSNQLITHSALWQRTEKNVIAWCWRRYSQDNIHLKEYVLSLKEENFNKGKLVWTACTDRTENWCSDIFEWRKLPPNGLFFPCHPISSNIVRGEKMIYYTTGNDAVASRSEEDMKNNPPYLIQMVGPFLFLGKY